MMRRKLAAYTVMLIAGISAGYFIFEKTRLISGTLFLAGTGIAVFLVDHDNGVKRPGTERALCFFIMITGFMIFAANYAHYEGMKPETEQLRIYGRIINAEDRGNKLRLIIDDELSKRRISTDIKKSEDERSDISDYIGSKAEIIGETRDLAEADNPGCFDYRRYMRSKDIAYSLKAYSADVKDDGSKIWKLRKYLIREREAFLDEFDDDISGFLRGVIFGDKSEIDETVLREFNLNSSGHILAVSGLHIGFLYSMLKLLSGKRRTLPASIVIILALLMYGEMTMWSSSTVRAVVVLSLSILSVNLKRPFDLLSSVSAAAFVILLIRPYMLFNTGFQLSFAAMCSIAFLSRYMSAFIGEFLSAAASVQIGTIPLIAMSFHKVNTIALFINIPIILLSSFIVPICILFLIAGIITSIHPDFCIRAVTFLIEALTSLNRFLSFDGSFSNLATGIGVAATIVFYILLFIIASEWLRVNVIRGKYGFIAKSLSLLLIPILMMYVSLYDSFRNDEIVFVSVGQGDCTHIRCGEEDILIDGGGNDYLNTGERILMPYLLSQGVKDIDIAVLTHLHKDHYLGISELSEQYPIKAIAIPMEYKNSYEEISERADMDSEDIVSFDCDQYIYLNYSSKINIDDDVYIEVLWPLEKETRHIRIDDANEHNMVYMIHYKGIKIMVTGDLLEEDELRMVNHYKGSDRLKCDVLKVAHHGSKSSSSEAFLDAAEPSIAVIQVGRGNFYGHPHAQTLARLEERGIKTYRTDTDGAVGIEIRSKEIAVDTMR